MVDTKVEALISIIVPCYNYGNFLAHTLSHIGRQKYKEWECIIVDDGSTDNTRQVAAAFVNADSRFRYEYQENAGLSAARNKGLEKARGEFIQLLDADDLIDEQKLAIQAGYLRNNASVDIVYGDAVFFTSEQEATPASGKKDLNNTTPLKVSGAGDVIMKNLCVNNFIEVSAPLIRRSVFDKVGSFDTSYFTYEDWQFWFRCALAGIVFRYDNTPGTVTYIRYGHSSMLRNNKKKIIYGIKYRKFINRYLSAWLKMYNAYRLSKLFIKKVLG